MTELDDLKSAWQTLNRTLERQHALAFHQFKERKLARFRSAFRPLVTGQIVQIVCGALLSLLGGSFWVDHLGVAHLMVYGIALHLYGLMFIVFAARTVFLIQQMDFAAPVLVLQKQLVGLSRWRLQSGLWFAIAGCFIWIPAMLMIFYRLGADVWLHNPDVVGWLLLSGLVSLAVLGGIVYFASRPGREKFAEKLAASSTGRSVNRAREQLDEIERFERE
ncbi:MAG TPA: hypothetical protein VGF73_10015 [Chthoniobacterales bacterium]